MASYYERIQINNPASGANLASAPVIPAGYTLVISECTYQLSANAGSQSDAFILGYANSSGGAFVSGELECCFAYQPAAGGFSRHFLHPKPITMPGGTYPTFEFFNGGGGVLAGFATVSLRGVIV